MKSLHTYTLVVIVATMLLMQSCSQVGKNSAGSEFMPDMAHSVAYEANYYNYYYNNTWGSEEDYHKDAQPKLPVKGTIPRSKSSSISVPTANATAVYNYQDTEEERARAMAEIIDNPHAITDAGLKVGKELYNINCAICHGEKGDGNGYLVRDDGGVYPVQPAILTNEEFTAASNGRFYHSIMYGKNLMGSYRDKLSENERWEVIHYIRSLQAKANEAEYSQLVNTLNSVDRPAGEIKQLAEMNSSHSDMADHGHQHSAHDADTGHQNNHADKEGQDGHESHDGHSTDHNDEGHDNTDHGHNDHNHDNH